MKQPAWLKDCELCNAGVCKRIDELKDQGLSVLAAAKQMETDCEGLWDAEKIRGRYRYYKKGHVGGKVGGKPQSSHSKMLNSKVALGESKIKAAADSTTKPEATSGFNKSDIEWCDYTWNPVTGCKHDCIYCYAKIITNRFTAKFPKGFKPDFRSDRLRAPYNMGKPKNGKNKVFVCSMADLFGDWVPDLWINKVMKSVKENPKWTFIFLTKNPKRYLAIKFPENCWIGATVDKQEALTETVDVLAEIKDRVTFISFEPLTETINPSEVNDVIDWAIIGLESGNRKGRFIPELSDISEMIDLLSVPVFLKPNTIKCFPVDFPSDYKA